MQITYDDYIMWKSHPVTEAIKASYVERIEEIKSELAGSAGVDSLHDRFRAGYIQAIIDVNNVDFETLEGKE